MIEYIISLKECESVNKIEIQNKERFVGLTDIFKINTMKINDTYIDISGVDYMKYWESCDTSENLHFVFYNYESLGDAGMDLVEEFKIDTNLHSLNNFQLY